MEGVVWSEFTRSIFGSGVATPLVALVTDGVVWSDVERSIFRASVAGGVRACGGGLFTTVRLDDEPWLLSEETEAEIRMAAAFWVEDRRRSTEGGRRKGELVRLGCFEEPTEELSVEGDGLNRGAFGGGGGGGGGGGVS
jgi:hypothetical protein